MRFLDLGHMAEFHIDLSTVKRYVSVLVQVSFKKSIVSYHSFKHCEVIIHYGLSGILNMPIHNRISMVQVNLDMTDHCTMDFCI